MTTSSENPLLRALAAQQVSAIVVDLDHYRIHGGWAVETDYIISVQPSENADVSFEHFRLSKTYSDFRSLAKHIKKSAEKSCAKLHDAGGSIPPDLASAVKFAESLHHLVKSQDKEYLGKVSYDYVKTMAKQRSQILNDALDMITRNYPSDGPVLKEGDSLYGISKSIETFFLTDHCEEDDVSEVNSTASSRPSLMRLTGKTPSKKKHNKQGSGIPILGEVKSLFGNNKGEEEQSASKDEEDNPLTSPVVPISRKTRRSIAVRTEDEESLRASARNLTIDEDDDGGGGSATRSQPITAPTGEKTKSPSFAINAFFFDNPYVVVALVAVVLAVLRKAQFNTVTMDSDLAMLLSFACFCFGFNWPRPPSSAMVKTMVVPATTTAAPPAAAVRRRKTVVAPAATGPTARQLLRTSMMASPTTLEAAKSVRQWDSMVVVEEEEEEEPEIQSPMQTYPEGAELGEYFNCWSEPESKAFHVRGPNYLSDKVKVPSQEFIFPTRGVDLFLTDNAPDNVGSNSGCMGGRLRDVPTFIVNFRLPWGVLVFYSEIPERFLPFLHTRYDPFFDSKKLPSMDDMSPGDRTVARFLLGDDDHKNKTLKIVPVIVKGPWIVQSVAGSKPAIVGTKMPLDYVYGPKIGNEQSEYLEADLDIVGSAIARKICSVVTSYTSGVTIDLGFVVEGQAEDELPEQMLLAARLHGIDPISAPALPPMKDMFMIGDDPSLDDTED